MCLAIVCCGWSHRTSQPAADALILFLTPTPRQDRENCCISKDPRSTVSFQVRSGCCSYPTTSSHTYIYLLLLNYRLICLSGFMAQGGDFTRGNGTYVPLKHFLYFEGGTFFVAGKNVHQVCSSVSLYFCHNTEVESQFMDKNSRMVCVGAESPSSLIAPLPTPHLNSLDRSGYDFDFCIVPIGGSQRIMLQKISN
jgi:hypothetical protein